MGSSRTTGRGSVCEILASYPRTRPALPAANADRYVEEYKINRNESGRSLYRVVAGLESWMHRQISRRQGEVELLEIGAGTLNHRSYEPGLLSYDIVEPFDVLYQGSPWLPQIRRIYPTLSDVPLDSRYRRIISIAVLEHLEDLPTVIAQSALLLAPDGVFQAGIPGEGGLLWGLSWRLTTGLSYRLRTGASYRPVMRHEHLNSAPEIRCVLEHFFEDVSVRWFPFPHFHLSFYAYIEARRPRIAACRQWIDARMPIEL